MHLFFLQTDTQEKQIGMYAFIVIIFCLFPHELMYKRPKGKGFENIVKIREEMIRKWHLFLFTLFSSLSKTDTISSARLDILYVMYRNAFNPLPHMPILGFSDSAVNKDMMTKLWRSGVQLSD